MSEKPGGSRDRSRWTKAEWTAHRRDLNRKLRAAFLAGAPRRLPHHEAAASTLEASSVLRLVRQDADDDAQGDFMPSCKLTPPVSSDLYGADCINHDVEVGGKMHVSQGSGDEVGREA